jgi:hypothetical protein
MGPVVKLVLRFAHSFWEGLDDGRYRDAAFFFAPGTRFPTFWTSLRCARPCSSRGAAGPARLAGHMREELLQLTSAGLLAVFGRRNCGAMLEGCAWHDWQADPHARGAYSYVVAGGTKARKALAAPTHDTLYFAGEACDTGEEAGTVGGALASGRRAAKQVLAAAGRCSR